MPPRLTPAERRQAIAYRAMIRQARRRERATNPIKLDPPRGRQIDRSHKAAVARLFCIAAAIRFGIERYGVHVAHVRFSSAAFAAVNPGLQRKPDDRWTVSLCPAEHRLQHAVREREYGSELKLDPHALAQDLWLPSPDIESMLSALETQPACAAALNPT